MILQCQKNSTFLKQFLWHLCYFCHEIYTSSHPTISKSNALIISFSWHMEISFLIIYDICFSYQKFVKGKDLSNRSATDLDSIFGVRKEKKKSKQKEEEEAHCEKEVEVCVAKLKHESSVHHIVFYRIILCTEEFKAKCRSLITDERFTKSLETGLC